MNSIKEFRNQIYTYLCTMYGDEFVDKEMVDDMMKNELMSMGVLDGDDEMIWINKDKQYKFIINRTEISESRFNMLPGDPKYNINITIKDNMTGVTIDELNFSEIDAVRILDEIAGHCEYCYNSYDSSCIYINPSNTDIVAHMIILENIFESEYTTEFNKPVTKIRDIMFQILKYSIYHQERTEPTVTMKLSMEELNDLAFHLFFESLIDLDIEDRRMDEIEDYIIDDNPKNKPQIDPNSEEYYSRPIRYARYVNSNDYSEYVKPEAPKVIEIKPLSINEFNKRKENK